MKNRLLLFALEQAKEQLLHLEEMRLMNRPDEKMYRTTIDVIIRIDDEIEKVKQDMPMLDITQELFESSSHANQL